MKKEKRFNSAVIALIITVSLTLVMAGKKELNYYHYGADGAKPVNSLSGVDDWNDYSYKKLAGEVIYFVMPDRFYNGNSLNDYGGYRTIPGTSPDSDKEVVKHGVKKDARGYYHGGDLQGLIEKLDYLEELGITAIWITPVFKNNPVQGNGTVAGSSSAYHGYWITDFMQVDPHLGTNEEFKELVDTAHSRGIKVFMDIITNHTADIISYKEQTYDYISKKAHPFRDKNGKTFDDREYALAYSTGEDFPGLNLNSFPYTPLIPEELKEIKNPVWLNNPLYYHNRGNSTFSGENSIYGDFAGLDDLFTAHPRVVEGMVEIYKYWIKEFGVDGFRIDTVKHVNIEFWQQFAPEIKAFAREQGIPDFYMFGEVYSGNPGILSRYTTEGKLPAVLDFGLQGAVRSFVCQNSATDSLRDFFIADDYYTDSDSTVYSLPTFLGNHDMGRIGSMIARDNRDEPDTMLLKRDILAHSLLFTARGTPTIYYGDEQGFTGMVQQENGYDIEDQTARQDMFPSLVEEYTDPVSNNQIGTDTTPGEDNFDTSHILYKTIGQLADLRKNTPALSAGTQVHRYSTDDRAGDIYSFSRILKGENLEVVTALNNNASREKQAVIKTYHRFTPFIKIYPAPENFWEGLQSITFSDEAGEIALKVQPLETVVYQALFPLPYKDEAPGITITAPGRQFESGSFWISAELSKEEFAEVSFYVNEPEKGWTFAGRDDNPPYRVNYNASNLPLGSSIDIKAVVTTYAGVSNEAVKEGIKIENRMPGLTIHYENGNLREGVSALFSSGQMVYPRSLERDSLTVNWHEGSSDLLLLFETAEQDGSYKFDYPIAVNLLEDVYPYLEEVGDGTVGASIYINNSGEIGGSPNYTGAAVKSLPYNKEAANLLTLPLYIRGGLNGWGTGNEMVYKGNYTYETSIVLAEGSQEFKFADANWSVYNFGAPIGKDGLALGSNPANLLTTIPAGKGGRYKINYFVFPSLTNRSSFFTYYRFELDRLALGSPVITITTQ